MSGRRDASQVLFLEVPCQVVAPAMVRTKLAEVHQGHDWPLWDGIALASELVANALRHSGCDEDDLLRVEAELRGRDLVISVQSPVEGARRRFRFRFHTTLPILPI